MDENVLVSITVSRKQGIIEYKIDCSKEVKGEELSHYLSEIISGICTWRPEICDEATHSVTGKISEKNKKD